jgi:DNA-binding transcriptional regulator YiaG
MLNDVGVLLQAVHRRSGLSQGAFACELGIKLSRLQKWESGVNEPRFTIPELRRLRASNRPVFDALI